MSDERALPYLPRTKKENTIFPEGEIYLSRNHISNIPCKIEMSIRFCPLGPVFDGILCTRRKLSIQAHAATAIKECIYI